MKKLRKQKGFSQNELAQKLYVSQVLVSLWENGTREPNCQMILKLAEVLNCSVEEIVRCFA